MSHYMYLYLSYHVVLSDKFLSGPPLIAAFCNEPYLLDLANCLYNIQIEEQLTDRFSHRWAVHAVRVRVGLYTQEVRFYASYSRGSNQAHYSGVRTP